MGGWGYRTWTSRGDAERQAVLWGLLQGMEPGVRLSQTMEFLGDLVSHLDRKEA